MKNEHEKRDTISEDVFYPDHAPRTESPTFLHTKRVGHASKLPCAISGRTDKAEYHHLMLEWAFVDAVSWDTVKAIGTGELLELPVLDAHTDQPTGETFPVEQSLIWAFCKLASLRGFDWVSFDPTKPETFVDSMANMLVLSEKFHRQKGHGIHALSFPEWQFQAWPRKAGFVFTPDEEVQK